MNLVAGEIVEIYTDNETTMAKIRVRGAYLRVPLTLVPWVRVGESILVESGIAIAKIENTIAEEE
jgi:hydrogenase maturation factor